MRGIRFPLSHLFPLSLCAAKPKRACLLQLHFVFIIFLFIRKFHSSITLVFQCCLFRILKTYANSRLSYPRCFVSPRWYLQSSYAAFVLFTYQISSLCPYNPLSTQKAGIFSISLLLSHSISAMYIPPRYIHLSIWFFSLLQKPRDSRITKETKISWFLLSSTMRGAVL